MSVNLATLLPAHSISLDCAEPAEVCAARLARALTPPDQASLISRRVRGMATADGVRLWYSLRPRPARLAPQLFARWVSEGNAVRLVGDIRQEPVIALRVAATGAFMALVLLWMAAQGAFSWLFAIVGGAAMAGYPWIAWYMSSGDIDKIEVFLREHLGTGTRDPRSRM